jgi:hypothetical protein
MALTLVVAPPGARFEKREPGEKGDTAPAAAVVIVFCTPWFEAKGRLAPNVVAGCAAGDNDPAKPTTPPPKTTTISNTATANAFFERMAGRGSRFYDEGLSERSDKSIYHENAVFVTLSLS